MSEWRDQCRVENGKVVGIQHGVIWDYNDWLLAQNGA